MRSYIITFLLYINMSYAFHNTMSISCKNYDKTPTINYLNYLNSIKPVPIYSKKNLIKKTTYDDVFINLCDNNICEFIMDKNLTKVIVKYNNGICKIFYNSDYNDNEINKLIKIYITNPNNRVYFSLLNENRKKYFYQK